MIVVMAAALTLFISGCILCAVLGVRESRRAGGRRLPWIGPRGRLWGVDLVLYLLALACVVPAGIAFSHTDLSALVGLFALILGLGVPYVVITAVHNRRARRTPR